MNDGVWCQYCGIGRCIGICAGEPAEPKPENDPRTLDEIAHDRAVRDLLEKR